MNNFVIPGRYTKRIGGHFQGPFKFPTIARLNGLLQICLFLQQVIHFIITHGFGELHTDLIKFLQQITDFRHTLLNDFPHGLFIIKLRFLWQEPDTDTWLRTRLTIKFLIHSGHDPQHG